MANDTETALNALDEWDLAIADPQVDEDDALDAYEEVLRVASAPTGTADAVLSLAARVLTTHFSKFPHVHANVIDVLLALCRNNSRDEAQTQSQAVRVHTIRSLAAVVAAPAPLAHDCIEKLRVAVSEMAEAETSGVVMRHLTGLSKALDERAAAADAAPVTATPTPAQAASPKRAATGATDRELNDKQQRRGDSPIRSRRERRSSDREPNDERSRSRADSPRRDSYERRDDSPSRDRRERSNDDREPNDKRSRSRANSPGRDSHHRRADSPGRDRRERRSRSPVLNYERSLNRAAAMRTTDSPRSSAPTTSSISTKPFVTPASTYVKPNQCPPGPYLFIGNIPYHMRPSDLSTYFMAVDPHIKPIHVHVKYPPQRIGTGYAFVSMASTHLAREALRYITRVQYQGRVLNGYFARGPPCATLAFVEKNPRVRAMADDDAVHMIDYDAHENRDVWPQLCSALRRFGVFDELSVGIVRFAVLEDAKDVIKKHHIRLADGREIVPVYEPEEQLRADKTRLMLPHASASLLMGAEADRVLSDRRGRERSASPVRRTSSSRGRGRSRSRSASPTVAQIARRMYEESHGLAPTPLGAHSVRSHSVRSRSPPPGRERSMSSVRVVTMRNAERLDAPSRRRSPSPESRGFGSGGGRHGVSSYGPPSGNYRSDDRSYGGANGSSGMSRYGPAASSSPSGRDYRPSRSPVRRSRSPVGARKRSPSPRFRSDRSADDRSIADIARDEAGRANLPPPPAGHFGRYGEPRRPEQPPMAPRRNDQPRSRSRSYSPAPPRGRSPPRGRDVDRKPERRGSSRASVSPRRGRSPSPSPRRVVTAVSPTDRRSRSRSPFDDADQNSRRGANRSVRDAGRRSDRESPVRGRSPVAKRMRSTSRSPMRRDNRDRSRSSPSPKRKRVESGAKASALDNDDMDDTMVDYDEDEE